MSSRYNISPINQMKSPDMKRVQGSAVRGGERRVDMQPNPWNPARTVNGSSNGGPYTASREGTQSPPSPEPSVSSSDTVYGHVHYSGSGFSPVKGAGANHPWSTGLNPGASPYRGSVAAVSPEVPYDSPETTRSTPRAVQGLGLLNDFPQGRRVIAYGSPQLDRHVARASQDPSSTYNSPVKSKSAINRRGSVFSESSGVRALPFTPGRESMISNASPRNSRVPASRRSSNVSASAAAVSHSSGLLHPAVMTNNIYGNSMHAIPEEAAVQEFAFRRGQQDRGNTRDRVPPNPFHPQFSNMWEAFYVKGKQSSGDPILLPENPPSPSRGNYDWAPLVNAYTQTPEHPDGIYDQRFSREVCVGALDAMEKLIRSVCKRTKQWDKTVCDVPAPIADAICMNYPDLFYRYDYLRGAAKEAIGGGLPFNR